MTHVQNTSVCTSTNVFHLFTQTILSGRMTLHRGHDSTTGQCRVILWFCSTFQHRPGLKIPNQTFLRSSQAVIQRKYLWNFLESPHKMLMFLRRFKANLKGVRQIIGNRACSFFAVFLITPCNVLCTVYTVNHLLFIKKTKQKTNKNTPKSKQIADNHCLWEKKKRHPKKTKQATSKTLRWFMSNTSLLLELLLELFHN